MVLWQCGWLVWLIEEQKGRAESRQGILPHRSHRSPRAQPCCRAWHLHVLKVTSSSVCQVGHETMGYSFVEKDKLQISQHSTDKNQTAPKVTHSKTGNVISTWVHAATGSFSAFPTQVCKFLRPIPVHRPSSHWVFQTFLTPVTINSTFSVPSCEDTAVTWILITK